MPQELMTLTPDYVNAAKPGKRYASIKVGNVYYSFDPKVIPLEKFTKGRPATVEVKVTAEGYNNIVRLVEAPQTISDAVAQQRASAVAKADLKDETITRLAIAKSCIEAGHPNSAEAEKWLAWVLKKPQQPKTEEPNDEIPF